MMVSARKSAGWWVLSRSANPQLLQGFAPRGRSWPGPIASSTSTHPLPPRGSPPADRRDRRAARPAPVHHLSGAGAQPLPRRRPGLLRLLPPERPGPGAPTPAATSEAGRRRRPAGARGRAAQGRLVAAADRRTAETGTGPSLGLPRDDLPPRLRARGPGGRPVPPPAEGAPAARVPLRPEAAQRLDTARALDREPAGRGRRPAGGRARGGQPADLP